MVFSYCLCHHQLALKINLLSSNARNSKSTFGVNTEFYGTNIGYKLRRSQWSLAGGSQAIIRLNSPGYFNISRRSSPLQASLFVSPGDAFTLGTVAVLPFYTLMVAAPNAELTKKCMRSSIPYVVLGILYSYLLYLSWTPDTIRFMFASKYWLPELPGVAKMFSNEMTLASAWIHLLAVDLYAARYIRTDWRTKSRLAIPFLFAYCSVQLGYSFMPLPRHSSPRLEDQKLRFDDVY